MAGARLRVRIDGFDDDESGIGAWNFTVTTDGGEYVASAGELLPGELVADSSDATLLNGTTVVVTVAVPNRAGLVVEAISSPLLVVLEEIEFDNVTVVDGAWQPLAAGAWLSQRSSVAARLTAARLPKSPATTFTYTWALATAPCAAPASVVPLGDVLEATDDGTPGGAALWAKSLAPGIEPTIPPTRFCALATACTEATATVPARCKNATSAPFGFDATAPTVAAAPLWPTSNGIRRWGSGVPLRVSVSCADVESGVGALFLSLGSTHGASDLLEALPLPLPANASTNGSLAFSGVANRTAVRGVVRVGAAALTSGVAPADGTRVFASATCTNRAGLAARSANNDAAELVVDNSPPRAGALRFPSLSWSEGDGRWHGGVPSAAVPLAIDGFDDDGTGVASLSVCVKSSALGAACDVHSATLDGGERAASFFTAEMLAAFFTAEMLASQDSAAFFVAVTAVDGMGRIAVASAELVLDWSPPVVGNLTIDGASAWGRARRCASALSAARLMPTLPRSTCTGR